MCCIDFFGESCIICVENGSYTEDIAIPKGGDRIIMERNVNFPFADLKDISIRLAWAQLDIYADDIDQIQVIASGDAHTLSDLRIAVKEDVLIIEQPQYGISLDITRGHWMQLCVRVPRTWDQSVHASTISGFVGARGLGGSAVEIETVSGDIKAAKLTAGEIALRTTAGTIHGDQLMAAHLSGRSVSGDITLDDVAAETYRVTNVSGDVHLKLQATFAQMDLRTVSGDLSILTELKALQVSMRSVSGHKVINGIEITEDKDAPVVHATGVSGDLKIIGIRE